MALMTIAQDKTIVFSLTEFLSRIEDLATEEIIKLCWTPCHGFFAY